MNAPLNLRWISWRTTARVLVAFGLGAAGGAQAQSPASASSPILPVFFSPSPPVLGDPLPTATPPPERGQPAPLLLAAYVGEPFYEPLSTRLIKGDLGDGLKFQLEAYRADKTALQAELRARLDNLKEADFATRQRALAEFSDEAGGRAVELEKTAERLRAELSAGGSSSNEYLRWKIDIAGPVTEAGKSRSVKSWSVRLDAAFRAGLSPAQRRLLQEVAIELAAPPAKAADPAFFFSPDLARIRAPAALPPELAAKIADYRREKHALKKEIISVLYPGPKLPPLEVEAQALRALAEAQAPRLAALEKTAEDIRSGLTALGDPTRPPDAPQFPPELAARIAAYRQEKIALQKALLARVDEMKQAPPDPASSIPPAQRIGRAIAAFTSENAARYAALDKSRDSIRSDVAKLADASGPGNASPDALMAKFSDSLRQLESYWDYRDYQNAVFQPGLSPELRRLLFDAAMEKLALPLPPSEIRPP